MRPDDGPGARVAAARAAVESNPAWYHTIELAPGVATPGVVDLRGTAAKVLPDEMRGRALDVGTFDGFWAFEMERRGAEVVACDLPAIEAAELPPVNRERVVRESQQFGVTLGAGFRAAAAVLESHATHITCPVYELAPDRIGGPVDTVFIGALLVHLRDPIRALERAWDCLAPGGELYVLDHVWVRRGILGYRGFRGPAARFRAAETHFNWWEPNAQALMAYLGAAGFTDVRFHGIHRPKASSDVRTHNAALTARRP